MDDVKSNFCPDGRFTLQMHRPGRGRKGIDSTSNRTTWQGHEELKGHSGILAELEAPTTTTQTERARYVPSIPIVLWKNASASNSSCPWAWAAGKWPDARAGVTARFPGSCAATWALQKEALVRGTRSGAPGKDERDQGLTGV